MNQQHEINIKPKVRQCTDCAEVATTHLLITLPVGSFGDIDKWVCESCKEEILSGIKV